jgi:hypothetical protein
LSRHSFSFLVFSVTYPPLDDIVRYPLHAAERGLEFMRIDVGSEIGSLEGVILHTPGPEVENMTPQNAERALYSDILNLSVAQKEYDPAGRSAERGDPHLSGAAICSNRCWLSRA